jgi:hypothetical protein
VIPVVTPEEMKAVDRAAPEPVEVLVERAGAAVARAALSMLGGAYGRRVVVVAGKGNNGADGRVAAELLRRRGVRVAVIDSGSRVGNVLALPVFSAFRLELVCVPMAAFGLSLGLQRAAQRVPALARRVQIRTNAAAQRAGAG